jgi:hypothetical protein
MSPACQRHDGERAALQWQAHPKAAVGEEGWRAVAVERARREIAGKEAAVAKRQNIDLFRRFAVMRYWREVRHVAFARSLAPDGLHMNDWSYGCMANLLASAIGDASSTPAPQTAGISAASSAQR